MPLTWNLSGKLEEQVKYWVEWRESPVVCIVPGGKAWERNMGWMFLTPLRKVKCSPWYQSLVALYNHELNGTSTPALPIGGCWLQGRQCRCRGSCSWPWGNSSCLLGVLELQTWTPWTRLARSPWMCFQLNFFLPFPWCLNFSTSLQCDSAGFVFWG